MSNDIQRADQIAHRVYTKLANLVVHARSTQEHRTLPKPDKWFNLETPDMDCFKDHLRLYRTVSTSSTAANTTSPSSSSSSPSASTSQAGAIPFELQVLLTVPELNANQVLVSIGPDSSRRRIDPTPQLVLLESWTLTFTPLNQNPSQQSLQSQAETDLAPSTIYKHGIGLFRSLYTFLRVMPAWKLYRRLSRRRAGSAKGNGTLGIMIRVKPSNSNRSEKLLGFDSNPSASSIPHPSSIHTFPSVPHPTGTLTLSTTYLTHPNFQLDDLESLLSSRLLSLELGDAGGIGGEFTPTLERNRQRDSISSSPGSLAVKTSLPASPPSGISGLPPTGTAAGTSGSLADRMMMMRQQGGYAGLASGSGGGSGMGGGLNSQGHVHTRTTSFPTMNSSPRVTPSPLPMGSRTTSAQGEREHGVPPGSGSAASLASSRRSATSTGADGGAGVGGYGASLARLRKESTGSLGGLRGSGVDLPSQSPSQSHSHSSSPGAGGLQIRRPTVNPFKSSTLSSSPSLNSPSPSVRQSSPLSGPAPGPLPVRQPSNLPALPLPPLTNITSSPTRERTGLGIVPPSPIGGGPGTSGSLGLGGGGLSMGSGGGVGRLSSSPVTPLRPSPPFQPGSLGGGAPGSLGDRRSLASNEGVSGSPGVGSLGAGGERKRYSSSFGHRYKDSGASAVSSAGASEGSGGASGSVGHIQSHSRRGSHGQGAGAGGSQGLMGGGEGVRERKDSEKKDVSPSYKYLSPNPDEEDLSAFMNDTDRPKPLMSRQHTRAQTQSQTQALQHRRGSSSSSAGSPLLSLGLGQGQGQAHDRQETLRGYDRPEPLGGHSPSPLGSPRFGITGAAGRRRSYTGSPASGSPSSATGRPVGGDRAGCGSGEGSASAEGGRVGVLTSADAVGEELRRMNEQFSATLMTMGGRSRRNRDADADSASEQREEERQHRLSYRELESPRRRTERISEVTEESSGHMGTDSASQSGSIGLRGVGGTGSAEGSGRIEGLGLMLRTTRPGSRTDSITSEEVLGKLELGTGSTEEERRRSMGR